MEQTARYTNRRTYPRLPLTLRVECLSDGEQGPVHRAGSTTNVSAGGLYFQIPRGAHLKMGQTLLLLLRAVSDNGAHPRIARTWATVRRVDVPPGTLDDLSTIGVGAEFKIQPATAILELSD